MKSPPTTYPYVPFGGDRCGGCNPTLLAARRNDLIEPYLDALERELSWLGRTASSSYLDAPRASVAFPDASKRDLTIMASVITSIAQRGGPPPSP